MPANPLAIPKLSVGGDLGDSRSDGAIWLRAAPSVCFGSFPSLCNLGCKRLGAINRPSGSSDWDFTAGAKQASTAILTRIEMINCSRRFVVFVIAGSSVKALTCCCDRLRFPAGFSRQNILCREKSPTFRLNSLKPGSIGHWNFADGMSRTVIARRLSCRYTIRSDVNDYHALARVPQEISLFVPVSNRR